jgi:hypothetical protein
LSTTFEVYPRYSSVPSFREILDLGVARIREQLASRGVSARPSLDVHLRKNATHEVLPLDLSSPARWSSSEYAWFFVPGIDGGTDVTFEAVTSEDAEYWAELVDEHAPARERRSEVTACLANGFYWSFRRSAGQPGIVNFAYGILAATLAELTEGLVFSDDSAWDYSRFPATAQEVFDWYFRPEKAIDPDYASWARTSLAAIDAGDA